MVLMELHSVLKRQLNRLGLNPERPPSDLKQWQEFIEKVSKAYVEADQERYLIERSMELSSHEMLDLNMKLETAQQIAGMGYWVYDRSNAQITFSKELYSLFGLKYGDPLPTFEEFLQMVHAENRYHLKNLIEKAFSERLAYETEIRMKRLDGKYRWYRIYGRPLSDDPTGMSLTGIMMDITTRKRAQEKVALLNEQLIATARQVGMADVASATLHNVGNVLSSANVSAELLQENLDLPHYKNFFAIVDILKEHLPTLSEYLTQDPKGKIIPQYIVSLGEYIRNANEACKEELILLRRQIQHIKDIIGTQNTLARAGGMTEKVTLASIVDNALQLSKNSRKFDNIQIIKEYENDLKLIVDKTKLLQILVNLIQNAKESLAANKETGPKLLRLSIQKDGSNKKIKVILEDSGVGILKDNITKIFSLGFSTKDGGHGFGLHTSAIAAQEMGGAILAESKGEGKGAIFTLILPYVAPNV